MIVVVQNLLNLTEKKITQLLVGAFIVLSGIYLHFRILDSDEGFYLVAAKHFFEQLPYVDYFFTQAPLTIPYYAIFTALPLPILDAARIGALVASFVALWVVYHTAKGEWGHYHALLAFFLLGFNFFFIQWGVVAKTYAPTLACIGLFLYGGQRYLSTKKTRYLVLASFGIGLGTGFRLLMGVLGIPLLYLLYQEFSTKRLAWAIGGGFLGLVPTILFVLPSFDRFWYNTLQWHTSRSWGLITEFEAIWGLFVGSAGGIPILFLGNIILFGLGLIGIFVWIKQKNAASPFHTFLFLGLIVLFIAVILTPLAREQYFVILLPFLVLWILPFWPKEKKWSAVLLVLVLLPTILLVGKPILLGSNGIQPGQLDGFGSWIGENISPSGKLVSHDSLFPLIANREPGANLSMGRTNYTNTWGLDTERVEYYHLHNRETFDMLLSQPGVEGLLLLDDLFDEENHAMIILTGEKQDEIIYSLSHEWVVAGRKNGFVLLKKE